MCDNNVIVIRPPAAVVDMAARVCAAVDPAEPDKVLAAAAERGLTITTILTTHQVRVAIHGLQA